MAPAPAIRGAVPELHGGGGGQLLPWVGAWLGRRRHRNTALWGFLHIKCIPRPCRAGMEDAPQAPLRSVSRRSVAVAGGAPRPTAVMRAFLGTEAPEWSGSLRQRYTAEPAPWAHVRTIHEE